MGSDHPDIPDSTRIRNVTGTPYDARIPSDSSIPNSPRIPNTPDTPTDPRSRSERAASAAWPDDGEDLCSLFVTHLPVTGVSISVVGATGQSTIGASDATAAQLEQAQFGLGEGPHWDALRDDRAVLAPHLHRDHGHAWPVFAAEAHRLGAAAMFAFPLRLGAATVGVVDMYRTRPGALSADTLGLARALCASTAYPALEMAARTAQRHSPPRPGQPPGTRREVHQAVGMILTQLGAPAADAFSRLQAHAFATGATLEDVAHQVVTRRLRFPSDPNPGTPS